MSARDVFCDVPVWKWRPPSANLAGVGDDVLDERKRLFLRLGDRVTHAEYEEWGLGAVVEVMTSVVPGGTCIARILFEDGQQRTFINDMDSDLCCCYRGVRKEWQFDFGDVHRVSRGGSRRRLTGSR